jgi:hypothetical protein
VPKSTHTQIIPEPDRSASFSFALSAFSMEENPYNIRNTVYGKYVP